MKSNGKKEQIIEAAEKLFSEKNYGNTQISEIAKAAGVGIGTFYRYFPDKEALLTGMLTELMSRMRRELAETRRGIEGWAPLEQIMSVRRTFEVSFDVMLSRPNLVLTFLRSGYGGSGNVSETVWNLTKDIIHDLAEDVGRAEREGILEIPDKELLAHSIIGIVLQLIHKMIVEGKPSRDEAVNFCTRMTFGMLYAFIREDKIEKYLPLYRMMLPPLATPKAT